MTQFNPETTLKKLITPLLLDVIEVISIATRQDISATEFDNKLDLEVLRAIDDLTLPERKQVIQLASSWLEFCPENEG